MADACCEFDIPTQQDDTVHHDTAQEEHHRQEIQYR